MRSHAEEIKKEHPLTYHALSKASFDLSFEDKMQHTLEEHPTITELITYDVEDHFFERRVRTFCQKTGIRLTIIDSPGFITTKEGFKAYDKSVKKPFMHTFYQQQRKAFGILLENDGKSPLYGSWSFDAENRKKLPRGIRIPAQPAPHPTEHTEKVKELVDELFPNHPGSSENFQWATTRTQILGLLDDFLKKRFEYFGPYEDAISSKETFIFHSVLSPYINMGLVTPDEVVDKALEYYTENDTHYPSVEGFIRQIIGWREFMRGVYHTYDNDLNKNHFNHKLV